MKNLAFNIESQRNIIPKIIIILIGFLSISFSTFSQEIEENPQALLDDYRTMVLSHKLVTNGSVETDFSMSTELFDEADSLLILSIREFNRFFARKPHFKYKESKESQHIKMYEYFIKNAALIDSAQVHCDKALKIYQLGTQIRTIEHKIRDEEKEVHKKVISMTIDDE